MNTITAVQWSKAKPTEHQLDRTRARSNYGYRGERLRGHVRSIGCRAPFFVPWFSSFGVLKRVINVEARVAYTWSDGKRNTTNNDRNNNSNIDFVAL